MIIDGHAHAAREYSSVETLKEILDKNSIDKVILCPSLKNTIDLKNPPKIFFSQKEIDPIKGFSASKFIRMTYTLLKQKGDGNVFVKSLVEQEPDRIIQFYWVNMKNKNIITELAGSYENMKFKGIKIHQAWTPFNINNDLFLNVLEFAGTNNLPIFIHPYSLKELKKIKFLSKQYTNVVFIIGHLLGYKLFEDEKNNNIFHDISPHVLCTEAIKYSIKKYGSSRIIFGSDMPFGKVEENLNKILELNISEKDKENILGNNIRNLLRI